MFMEAVAHPVVYIDIPLFVLIECMVLYLYIKKNLFFLNEKDNERIDFNKQQKAKCDI